METGTLTGELADHVLAVRSDALPRAAIDMARHIALDGLAVMLAGATGRSAWDASRSNT
jgi:hypothetical protein